MKLLSLFDGEGGFPLAATMNGIESIYASEIEPFPIAVTRSRFPNMKHLGNVTEINGAEIDAIDIISFGSPCQDMSVAGKRAGLKHDELGDEETTRSGLFFEAIRIIKEMRIATNGRYPRFAVWENVPGAFSSNGGRDFLAVLQAFASVCEPAVSIPEPARNGKSDGLIWLRSGCIVGNGWSLAWRQLDAKYFGVPQRRKRIYLVADFGSERAEEILLERYCLRGNITESGETRERTSEDAKGCVDGGCAVECLNPWDSQTNRIYSDNGKHPAVSANSGGGQDRHAILQSFGFAGKASPASGSIGFDEECAATLRCGQQTHVIALQANGIDRADTAGCNGAGWREDQSYTLNTINRHAVCYPSTIGTLAANAGGLNRPAGNCNETDFCVVAPKTIDGRNAALNENLSGTLQAKSNGGFSYNCINPLLLTEQSGYIVRRLMPIETLRLQGYPDWWHDLAPFDGDVEFWESVRKTWAEVNGKQHRPFKTIERLKKWYNGLRTDAAEYKADGNSLAIPCAEYVMRRIAMIGEAI